ncbi:hypothetical protein BDN72DRAFT_940552, partial [Pluteus cervinus]
MDIDFKQRVKVVREAFNEADLSLSEFVFHILQSTTAVNHHLRQDLLDNAAGFCQSFYSQREEEIFPWAFSLVEGKLAREVVQLTERRHGLQFGASSATADFMEGPAFMDALAEKMQRVTPLLCQLVGKLLDANPSRRRVQPEAEGEIVTESGAVDTRGDGPMEIGGDEMSAGVTVISTKSQRDAEKRHAALCKIKTVSCISIMLQSSNERCNYLQSVMGIFFHSTNVPEKAIEAVAHAGLSISPSSINSAVRSLSKDAERRVRDLGQTRLTSHAYDNFDSFFNVAETTNSRSTQLVSATSATSIPLFGVKDPAVLQCSAELWSKDPRNPLATAP